MDDIKLCTVMPVPDDRFIRAALAAIEENEANRPMRTLARDIAPGAIGPAEMAVLTGKRWQPGRTLRAQFIGGSARVRERLIPFARQWEDHANLILDFVGDGDGAELRVAFQPGGSWSYLGTDALVIDADQPTMNYGWLTPDGPDEEYSRVVLHEFGHALACVHEHEHPESGIPWDQDKVYEYYEQVHGWSRTMVDQNVLHRYDRTETNSSSYDRDSIMHYAVPNELTIGDFSVGWNRALSKTDKSHIATVYPRASKEPIELRTGETVQASIGEHEEEDLYTFYISRSMRRADLFTEGMTDVVVAIYGPDDSNVLYAWDDDSGQDRNARIRRQFHKGNYLVRVRHSHPRETGEYTIRLNLGA